MIGALCRVAAGSSLLVLGLALSAARLAQAAPAPGDHCADLRTAIDRDEDSHEWAKLLLDGMALQHDCAAGNDITAQGADFAIAVANLRTGEFGDALDTAKKCEAITSTKAYWIQCRLVEASALDGLGRIDDEKAVLIAILDSLPSRGAAKLRSAVKAELAAIDPAAAKEHGRHHRSHAEDASPDAIYTGTGFAVSTAGHIVTNWHVVAECSAYWTVDGRSLSLVRGDKARDLALLQTTKPGLAVAGLRADAAKVGEPIVVYGFPLAGLLASSGSVTTGIVSASAGIANTAKEFQISAPIQPGNSGSPVLDAEGRVIGVANLGLDPPRGPLKGAVPQNVNFAVAEAELLGFLKDAGVTPTLQADGPKLEVTDIAAAARGFVTQIRCTPHA